MKTEIFFVPFLIALFLMRNICISADDRFMKRYALMKMYESCFGPEAVKEARKEMKIALAKCSDSVPAASQPQFTALNVSPKPSLIATFLQTKHHHDPADSSYSPEHLKSHSVSNIDLNKLRQAILTGYNNKNIQQQQQPTLHSNLLSANGGFGFSPIRSWNYAIATNTHPYPQNNGLMAFQPSPEYMPSLHYPMHPIRQYPFLSPFYGNGRSSRDLDMKSQVESLAVSISGRIKNTTCIMQELGYLTKNLKPDYQTIIERMKKLKISDDLKSEMIDSVEYCKKFLLCVSEDGKNKFSQDMVKSMFFFRCYKHKKLEACIMKDIKDRYSSNYGTDENTIGTERNDRSKHILSNNEFDELGFHEFLYGISSFDIDDIM